MVREQLETTGFLRLVRCCVIELPGVGGACHSGRSIDCTVVSKNFRCCVRNVRADKGAPWSAHVAIAFDVMRKPSKIRTWQLVSPSPLSPQAPSHSRDEWLKRFRLVENVVPSNSPQEATPSSYPSSFPCGLWHQSGTSGPDVSWKDPRSAGGRGERPAPNFPLEAHTPQES